jgi:hypothetical protein
VPRDKEQEVEIAEMEALEGIMKEVASKLLPRGVEEPLWPTLAPSVLYPRQILGVLQYIMRDAPCWYEINVCPLISLLTLIL